MKNNFCDRKLRRVASECPEFEHVITAMGYGYSLLNVSPGDFVRRCSDCVHWLGGSCNIFRQQTNS